MTSQDKIHVLDKRIALYQPAKGFRTSIDAVLLAAACPAKAGQSVLDLGCGVGSAGLCVLKRVGEVRLTGLDIQDDHVELAKKNAEENGFQATFLCGDVRGLKDERFDHVICNPPYLESGTHTQSPSPSRAKAMGDTDVQIWVDAALRNLNGRGSLTMIHRADAIDDILYAFGGRFGNVEIIPLWPKIGKPAGRIVIRAVKDSNSPAILHAGLVLHQENGDYTQEAENILRNAAALI